MTAEDDAQTPDWLSKMRPTFKPGDRVRVRLGGECNYCEGDEINGLNGRVGTISHIDVTFPGWGGPSEDAHCYWVQFDEPVKWLGRFSHYAPQELEPLTQK